MTSLYLNPVRPNASNFIRECWRLLFSRLIVFPLKNCIIQLQQQTWINKGPTWTGSEGAQWGELEGKCNPGRSCDGYYIMFEYTNTSVFCGRLNNKCSGLLHKCHSFLWVSAYVTPVALDKESQAWICDEAPSFTSWMILLILSVSEQSWICFIIYIYKYFISLGGNKLDWTGNVLVWLNVFELHYIFTYCVENIQTFVRFNSLI